MLQYSNVIFFPIEKTITNEDKKYGNKNKQVFFFTKDWSLKGKEKR